MTLASLFLVCLLAQMAPGATPPAPSSLPPREAPARAGPEGPRSDCEPSTRAEPGASPRRPPPHVSAAVLYATFADDPPIGVLRSAATALALAEPTRAESLIARARWAALLPEVRMRLDRRYTRTESLNLEQSATDPLTTPVGVDSINDVRYEWRATWDLARIVFNPDEIGASTHALRMAEVRREIETVVIRLYFERRHLKAEGRASDALDTTPGVRGEIHIQEIEAELDALTGGAFSRWRAWRAQDSSTATP
jgi:hypothetical protein